MEPDRERLRNLLLLLIQALDEDPPGGDGSLLAGLVHEAGFDIADLAALQDWVADRWPLDLRLGGEATAPCQRPGRGTVRLQAEVERDALTVPAFGYLMRLVRTGQISAVQMETLIQFAEQLAGSPLDPADLDPLLEHVVFAGGRLDMAWRATDAGERPH